MALHAPGPWNVVELCAGAGGLGLGIELGARLLGGDARGVCYVEREAPAAAALVARMEAGDLAAAPVWSDLATFDGRPWAGVVDVVASGDPCQPNSHAGKRLGAADDRFLIHQLVRVVGECRPDRVFRENVTGNADGQLAALVPALEGLGYRVAAGIFSSAETGNSHGRERLFVMADRDGGGAADEPFSLAQCGGAADAGPGGERVAIAQRGDGAARADAAGLPAGARADGDAGRSGIHLVDAARHGWRQGRAEHARQQGRRAAAGTGGALAFADGGRRHARRQLDPHEGERLSGSDGLPFAADAGEQLADADGAGLAIGLRDQERRGTVGHEGAAAGAGRLVGLPLVAPGPGDRRWPAILALDPTLEPALCRMAHAMADRVDRLRLCGNGVDPVAAGYAWVALDALLRAGGAAGPGQAALAA